MAKPTKKSAQTPGVDGREIHQTPLACPKTIAPSPKEPAATPPANAPKTRRIGARVK
jgi:hypothetical protein